MARKKLKVSQRSKVKTVRFYPWTIKDLNRIRKDNKQTFSECVRVIIESYVASVTPKMVSDIPTAEVVN